MNVYSIEVKIVATAYIRADSEDEARAIFDDTYKEHCGGELPTSDSSGMGDLEVSGLQYDDPHLPECSLSPAITFYGSAADDGKVELDLVETDVPETEMED